MSASWNTKWGVRRVRNDPPTLAEALVAAQGFTDDLDGQAEIAAGLMGVSVAEARAALRKAVPDRRTATVVTSARDKGALRTVIVERKTSRRLQAPAASRPSGASLR